MNERTYDDSETRRQRQSEDLPKQGMSNTCSEPNKRQHTNTIRYFSMFTGVGGFELGLENSQSLPKIEQDWEGWNRPINEWGALLRTRQRTSFRCIGMSEWDKYSSQVLRYKFPNIKNWGDCTKIKPEDLPDFDMLCGGFPCQAFSIAGKRRGFEDTRGTMFFEVARILEVKRPKIVLLENVKGLLNHDKGKTFRVIIQTLDELGYEVQWMVLNSKFFGVPQNRERVLIIGNLRGEHRPEVLPFGEDDGETPTKIQCFQRTKDQHSRVYDTEGISPTLAGASKLSGDCTPKIKTILDLYNKKEHADRSPTLTEPHHNTIRVKEYRAVLTPDRKEKRQNGRRFKEPGEPAFTVTGQDIHGIMLRDGRDNRSCLRSGRTPEVGYEGYSIRRLTPTECCRLQGFPDDWNEFGTDDKGAVVKMSDTQRYKQMGNAVTTNVIAAVGSQILNNTTEDKNDMR